MACHAPVYFLGNSLCGSVYNFPGLFAQPAIHAPAQAHYRCGVYLPAARICQVFAIAMDKDTLDWVKILSAVLIFAGVYLVTSRVAKNT